MSLRNYEANKIRQALHEELIKSALKLTHDEVDRIVRSKTPAECRESLKRQMEINGCTQAEINRHCQF